MNRILALSALISVLTLSSSSLAPNSRYGAPQSRNSLNYRGDSRYPSHPAAPSAPHAPRTPVAPAYGGNQGRNHGYGSSALHQSPRVPQQPRVPQAPVHQAAPGLYGGAGRHYNSGGSNLNHYSAPAAYGGSVPFSGHAARGISQRSVYEQPAYNNNNNNNNGARNNHSPQQTYAQTQQRAQATSHTHGREMRYEVRDPQNRGTTHVTETHIVSNKQMHGAEAEAAMKKLMGSMGPGSDGGFNDFFKGVGLPFY